MKDGLAGEPDATSEDRNGEGGWRGLRVLRRDAAPRGRTATAGGGGKVSSSARRGPAAGWQVAGLPSFLLPLAEASGRQQEQAELCDTTVFFFLNLQ